MHRVRPHRERGPDVVLAVPRHRLRTGSSHSTQRAIGGQRRIEVDAVAADDDVVDARHVAGEMEGAAGVDGAGVATHVAREREGGHDRRRRRRRDAQSGQSAGRRRLEEQREARARERHAALDVRQLTGRAYVARDRIVIQRRRAVGVEKTDLVAVHEPAVRIHAAEVDAVSVTVCRHGKHRWKDGQAVACREQREVVGEDATRDVHGRGDIRPHGGIPRGNR